MARKREKFSGWVNVSIFAHPTKRHLADGWAISCTDSRPGLGADWPEQSKSKYHKYLPIEQVKAEAKRAAQRLFRKMLGRKAEPSDLRWLLSFEHTFPGKASTAQSKHHNRPTTPIKDLPKVVYVGRLGGIGDGTTTRTVTGPYELRLTQHGPGGYYSWVALKGEGKELREAVITLGEYVRLDEYGGARFADPDRASVERWLHGIRAGLMSAGKSFIDGKELVIRLDALSLQRIDDLSRKRKKVG